MSYTVSTSTLEKITLNQSDYVNSVLQNIAIIISTRQGTVPLNRDFGLPMEFLDRPINVAKVLAYKEVSEAIEAYEPRASLVDIFFSGDLSNPGLLNITVEVDIANE
ncbi:GPW/gp25 family protein [Bengtsoniella intestinalis]|uniref:GPW/gp25 family protein n=1 Tax=Bengtsoniella intestinalis TaxID=3073143 RepID=UPI00391F94F4